MNTMLYLLWSGNANWNVFTKEECPNLKRFTCYCYKQYRVPEEKTNLALEKLKQRKDELIRENKQPTRHNYQKLFPQLEELIA